MRPAIHREHFYRNDEEKSSVIPGKAEIQRVSWSLLFCVGLLGLSSCVPLHPNAVALFSSSTQTAQRGLEAVVARDVAWTREADVQTLATDKKLALSRWTMKSDSANGWTVDQRPDYWTVRDTQKVLEDLNRVFADYVALILAVSSRDLRSASDVNATAQSLNKDLRSLSAQEKWNLSRTETAGVCSIQAEALGQWAQHRRRRSFEKALAENQPWVESYADQCLSLIGIVRGDMKVAYADQVQTIQARWNDQFFPGRVTLTRSLLNLNEEYADTIESFKGLEDFYKALPQVHQDLYKQDRGDSPSFLKEWSRSAERIARLTQTLEASR